MDVDDITNKSGNGLRDNTNTDGERRLYGLKLGVYFGCDGCNAIVDAALEQIVRDCDSRPSSLSRRRSLVRSEFIPPTRPSTRGIHLFFVLDTVAQWVTGAPTTKHPDMNFVCTTTPEVFHLTKETTTW